MVIGLTAGGTVAFYTYTTYLQKFLVNTSGFSKATATEVSAAALFAPLFTPAGTPWEGIAGHDAKTQAFLDELHAHPAGQWVMRRYAEDRQRRS